MAIKAGNLTLGWTLMLVILAANMMSAQTSYLQRRQGESALERGQYRQALSLLSSCRTNADFDADIHASYGLALYHCGQVDSAKSVLSASYNALGQSMPPKAAIAYARILALDGRYMDAAKAYKRALGVKSLNSAEESTALLGLQHARSAILAAPMDEDLKVTNRSPTLDTTARHERYPVILDDGRLRYLATTMGVAAPYLATDIRLVTEQDATRRIKQPPNSLTYFSLRPATNGEWWWSASADKKVILVTASAEIDGQDTLTDLSPPYFPELGDQSWIQVSTHDYLFASLRPGGYGGYDLYRTRWMDGSWSRPENLGPDVNSPYHEIDPNIISSGAELIFSSNRPDSYGGFDFYVSTYSVAEQSWRKCVHLPMPLNSPGDEGGYVQGPRGVGYFHSDRTLGRGFDIYEVSGRVPAATPSFLAEVKDPIDPIQTTSTELTTTTALSPTVLSAEARLQLSMDSIMAAELPKALTMPVAGVIDDLPPLFYGRSTPHVHPQMRRTLDRIINYASLHHPMSVVLMVHAPNKASDMDGQPLSRHVTQAIMDYLSSRSAISSSSMVTIELDNQVPFLRDDADEVVSGMDRTLDQRIDVRLVRLKTPYLTPDPFDEGVMHDDWHERHHQLHELASGLSYMIQVDQPIKAITDTHLVVRYGDTATDYRYWIKSLKELLDVYDWLGRPSTVLPTVCYQGKALTSLELDQLKYYYPELVRYQALLDVLDDRP